MLVGIQNEILRLHSMKLLEPLLVDRTTKSNIIWATDAYQELGEEYHRNKEIHVALITGNNAHVIKNRAQKALEQQSERTRQHAEVFTPLWICQQMVSHADEVWFGGNDPFLDVEDAGETITFPKRKNWKRYVDQRRLEITCGEAPYLVNRYDVATGEGIPIERRQGILDRKLRIVNENASHEREWLTWALRAFQQTYGYEFQGDNLLIARLNLLMTYEEYLQHRWNRKPTAKEYREIIKVITWNIWQMDGLTGTIPYCKATEEFQQMNIFELLADDTQEKSDEQPHSRTWDWRRGNSLEYLKINTGGRNMKFDFVIGNPPYQDETIGDNSTYAPPIYHQFLDAAYQVADKVEMIHPARFLFDAGSTPKAWNKKMLNDPHFKVLHYEADSSKIFSNTDIKGGIAISYRDENIDFGAIGNFIVFDELRSIVKKVVQSDLVSISTIIYASESYKFNDQMHEEHPEVEAMLSKGHKYDFKTSVLGNLDNIIFFDTMPTDDEYVQILGLVSATRKQKWIKRKYISAPENFEHYKVFIPAANGSGALGEVLSTPLIGQPLIGHTQTFLSVGCFQTLLEAENCLKYIKSKFARVMLGVLKITQHNPAPKWKYVPLQDFTAASDIDWSRSIPEIDRQLYAKYGLSDEEIEFIESHVKEMA